MKGFTPLESCVRSFLQVWLCPGIHTHGIALGAGWTSGTFAWGAGYAHAQGIDVPLPTEFREDVVHGHLQWRSLQGDFQGCVDDLWGQPDS